MDNRAIADEWFAFAECDLKSARFLQDMNPQPLEIICYHCQQSAEKYLKGYIALNGGRLIKTHDLTLLNRICKKYDSDFKEIEDDAIELVDYGVQARYPFTMEIEVHDMRKAAESAERIRDFVERKSKKVRT
ncbi:MAG TPA: HEPN domain-containing protein [Thermoanaerobacterales bacterium]|nr:HEPN domain-containing protein [Thermoanaerobacterales bacterium]